jgi:hypothetical protein
VGMGDRGAGGVSGVEWMRSNVWGSVKLCVGGDFVEGRWYVKCVAMVSRGDCRLLSVSLSLVVRPGFDVELVMGVRGEWGMGRRVREMAWRMSVARVRRGELR